ncbi:hypothetical protein M3Y95_00383700 [Aphelenchoides besseyi]|nr:hypothetical protein M3Y95_00383700 [Aphelenchoides besseyi]
MPVDAQERPTRGLFASLHQQLNDSTGKCDDQKICKFWLWTFFSERSVCVHSIELVQTLLSMSSHRQTTSTARSDDSPGGSTERSSAPRSTTSAADFLVRLRFNSTLGVLVSMGLAAILAHRLLMAESTVARLVGAFLVLLIGFFGHEWCQIHANGLTRQKRAHFDESNILETYQPRARTHGHLFIPDPPTPGPVVSVKEGDVPERSADEKAAWNANRNAHYADMFGHAMRVAKEQEAMEKATQKDQKTSPEQPKEVIKAVSNEVAVAQEKPKSGQQEVATASAESSQNSARKEASIEPDAPKSTSKPTDIAKAPIDLEQRADQTESGEPLYENIQPLDVNPPNAPRPPMSEQIQNAAQKFARTVSSKVRTALDTSSLRGALPSMSDTKSTYTAVSRSPPRDEQSKEEKEKSKRG